MRNILQRTHPGRGAFIIACCLFVLGIGVIATSQVQAASGERSAGQRLITIHDDGRDRGILTRATTLRQVFQDEHIAIDANDTVEPGLDDKLVANNYEVNVYRARPVTIVDGAIRQKVMSPYQTAKQIAAQANIVLHDEDQTTIEANTDMVSEGAGVRMTINRATSFNLVLYGTKTEAYTQTKTVADMLKEKKITLGKDDTLSVAKTASIQAGMTIELWRNGKQTANQEQDIAFDTEKIQDADQPVGYKLVKTPGVVGKKMVTYEIEMKNGQEVGRKEIQSVVSKAPEKQVEVVGVKISLPPGSHTDWMSMAGMQSGNYGYIDYIFTHESHWNPSASSPGGKYVGLGQTSPANLSASCPTWQSDPICQIHFFDRYAVSRYGSWEAAYQFKASKGWW
jgi:uncharacterized protein YabE (DUF348 family)